MKNQKSKIKNQNYAWVLIFIFISGCAVFPTRDTLPTYTINGVEYLSLVSLCNLKSINWEYDTFSRSVILNKQAHKINLMAGENIVLVDGRPQYLMHPVTIYQGTVFVPYGFKEQIIDILFKETPVLRKPAWTDLRIKKVVIDAGHGGRDPGAIGRTGLREKDLNLDIAKRLSYLLRSKGVNVVMTRSTDSFVSLHRRVEIANHSNADLFISIHANANPVRSLNGFEIYYVAANVGDSSRALSAAQQAVLDIDSSSFASSSLNLKAILWDMIYTYNRAQSIELASSICQTTKRNLNMKILGVKGARFYVLKGILLPAILIEVGFLSHYDEERMLKNTYYRQKIAEAIAEGIYSYDRDLRFAYNQ